MPKCSITSVNKIYVFSIRRFNKLRHPAGRVLTSDWSVNHFMRTFLVVLCLENLGKT